MVDILLTHARLMAVPTEAARLIVSGWLNERPRALLSFSPRPWTFWPPSSAPGTRRCPVGEPHVSAPARHYFVGFIAKQPIGYAAPGVHKDLIAVPMAVVRMPRKPPTLQRYLRMYSLISGITGGLPPQNPSLRLFSKLGNFAIHSLSTR